MGQKWWKQKSIAFAEHFAKVCGPVGNEINYEISGQLWKISVIVSEIRALAPEKTQKDFNYLNIRNGSDLDDITQRMMIL